MVSRIMIHMSSCLVGWKQQREMEWDTRDLRRGFVCCAQGVVGV